MNVFNLGDIQQATKDEGNNFLKDENEEICVDGEVKVWIPNVEHINNT